jgi:hypothetical protein
MEKEDYQWVILALAILLVVGLIIKPALTGETPNIQLPEVPALPALRMPTPLPVQTTRPVTIVTTQTVTTIATPVPATTVPVTTTEPFPTPTPAWTMQSVQFVDPGTYNLSLQTIQYRNLSQVQSPYRITDYTSILTSPIKGQYSGTTQVISIPFPYWELWYTVQPTVSDLRLQSEALTSYSTVLPSFSIDVVDAANPGSAVRVITPPGTLDPLLWQTDDPRPWKEKFLEGNKQYYLIIKANMLSSYEIDIKVPNSSLNKI